MVIDENILQILPKYGREVCNIACLCFFPFLLLSSLLKDFIRVERLNANQTFFFQVTAVVTLPDNIRRSEGKGTLSQTLSA